MENSSLEAKIKAVLETNTLFAVSYIKNNGAFRKDQFCFMYGAACGVYDLCIRLGYDVSFYEEYFTQMKKYAEENSLLENYEIPPD